MANVLGVTVEYLVHGKRKTGTKKGVKLAMEQNTAGAKIKILALKLIEQTDRM